MRAANEVPTDARLATTAAIGGFPPGCGRARSRRPQVRRHGHRQAREQTQAPDVGGTPDHEGSADGHECRTGRQCPDGLLPRTAPGTRTADAHRDTPRETIPRPRAGRPSGLRPAIAPGSSAAALPYRYEPAGRSLCPSPARARPRTRPAAPPARCRGERSRERLRSTSVRTRSANASVVLLVVVAARVEARSTGAAPPVAAAGTARRRRASTPRRRSCSPSWTAEGRLQQDDGRRPRRASTPVTTAHPSVRLTSRSISYRR